MAGVTRKGRATLRDRQGRAFVVMSVARAQALRRVARAAANLAAIQRALATSAGPLSIRDYGEWTWLRHLDEDDLSEFIHDMQESIIVAVHEASAARLDETLRAWRVTAQELEDPLRREVLLGGRQGEDFVDVDRPTISPA